MDNDLDITLAFDLHTSCQFLLLKGSRFVMMKGIFSNYVRSIPIVKSWLKKKN